MLESQSVFEFKTYKAYLESRLGGRRQRLGLRSSVARTLGCQPTYISQVLNGNSDFSLEQTERIGKFLGHSREEQHFFLLLVQKDRAGTLSLKEYFENQISDALERRLSVVERLGKTPRLSKMNEAIYYSSWIFAAVHIALTIPRLQNREALSEYLGLSQEKIMEALAFLIECGLAVEMNGRFQTPQNLVRIGRESHSILKHHANWRTQALISLEREKSTDLHYSSVFSVATRDVLRIKNLFLDSIKTNGEWVRDSAEEELCALTVDFFSMRASSAK